jgi:hypothetical protein
VVAEIAVGPEIADWRRWPTGKHSRDDRGGRSPFQRGKRSRRWRCWFLLALPSLNERACSGRRWCCTEGSGARFLPRCFQLFILNDQELVLPDLVAATFVVGLYHIARHGIDELLAYAVASFSIDLPE